MHSIFPPILSPRRILLVDDHPFMRMGLAQFINAQPDMQVCGEAGDPREAMQMMENANPDLVLSDLNLPGKGGLELIKDLNAMYPLVPVLVVSMHDEPQYAPRVLRAGARGYVMKSEPVARVAAGIRDVLKGKIVLSERMSSMILEIFAGKSQTETVAPETKLSDRELEVLSLIGRAFSTRSISSRLIISMKTVEAHRSNIKRKLNINSSEELVRYAVCWAQESGRSTEQWATAC
ncbi:MAG: response regulator transcription factor [Verrucomicrobiota bacterium]